MYPYREKAEAVAGISFTRRSSAFSARSCLSSAIVSLADCFDFSTTAASDRLRQRRRASCAAPGSFINAAIAFISDNTRNAIPLAA